MTLAFASKAVSPNGEIVLVGANDAGIRSANKAYENNIGPIEEKIVGNHSALYIGKIKKSLQIKKSKIILPSPHFHIHMVKQK